MGSVLSGRRAGAAPGGKVALTAGKHTSSRMQTSQELVTVHTFPESESKGQVGL